MFFNRLSTFVKRILASKLYIGMMISVILLSIIYMAIPDRKKEAQIRVGIYFEVNDNYSETFWSTLKNTKSIYTFYRADSLEALRQHVENGSDECGFYFPDGFFSDYINGISEDNLLIRYETQSSTLANAITEVVFSHIFKVTATDILYVAYGNSEQNKELAMRMKEYMASEIIFTLEDHTADKTVDKTEPIPVNIPVREASILLIVFAGLLGLLMYVSDAEKNYYIALRFSDRINVKLCNILGAILPIFIVCIICCAITYKSLDAILILLLSALFTVVFDFIPGFIFKKSSSLTKLLPIIMLILIPLVVFL